MGYSETCEYGTFLSLYDGGQGNYIFTTDNTIPNPH